MDYQIWVTIISTSGAIFAASLSYYLTKKHQLALEWRKEKINHYKELLSAISDLAVDTTDKDNANIRFATAVNTIALVANQKVITALMYFHDEIKYSNKNWSIEKENKLLIKLLLTLRKDVGLSKKDKEKTFIFHLIGSKPK
jgi:hypothetical protein